MKSIKERVIFIAISVFITLQCLNETYFSWWIVGFLWGIRILFLERIVQKWILCFLVLTIWINKQYIELNTFLETKEDVYQLMIDPYKMNQTQDSVQGEAIILKDNKKLKVVVVGFELNHMPLINKSQKWLVRGSLERPANARNFGVFDYQVYLRTKGIEYQLTIDQILEVQSVDSFQAKILNMRFVFLEHFRKMEILPLFGIYNKLVWNLGSKEYQQIKENMMKIGVIHFFALSGFHVSFIMSQLNYFFRRIGILNEIGEIMVYCLIVIYAFLTDFTIGVIRSILVRLLQRTTATSSIDSLSWVAIIVVLLKPTMAFSIGFQLSFLSSFLLNFIEDCPKDFPFSKSIFQTIVCTLFTWPIIIHQNFMWYPLQLIWVIVITKIFDKLFIPFIFVMTVLSFIPNAAERLLGNFSLLFSNISLSSATQPEWIIGQLNLFWIMILFLVANLWLLNWKKAIKWTVLSYILTVLLAGTPVVEQITILDVGQGDAMVYQKPFSREAIVIDVGGKVIFNGNGQQKIDTTHANKTIIPALKALGASQLTIIITHADVDHIGNLKHVVEDFTIQRIIINETTANSIIFKELLAKYNMENIEVLKNGYTYQLANKQLQLLTMQEDFLNKTQDQSNDSSIVSIIDINGYRIINMGDLSKEGEVELLKHYPTLSADIIKLGHHGSKTSSSRQWLQQLQPQLALVSAGVNNRYGHPHAEVLNLLKEENITYLQTNQQGAIQIQFDPFGNYHVKVKIEKSEFDK